VRRLAAALRLASLRAAGLGLHNSVCELARGDLGYAQQAGLWESGSKLPHSKKTTAVSYTLALRRREVNENGMKSR
jgi:hypothetical protein